ncbi:cytochrome P450 26A1-like isoform X1 [Biomphalaria glabrata]|uniref:Cytochrome P450 26A1-like isoform X1 n=2 Tax=Biomphalaria glabrata TaxID=6526 RepID=A0A9W3AUT5_BIOGL|nr:cytochrome P450 26A1-like isoform X1 [Biomphalaria glabrata]
MTPLVTPALVLLVTIFVCYLSHLLWKRKFDAMKDKTCGLPLPPGDMGWPLIGQNLQFAWKKAQFFVDNFLQYGNIYKTHIFGSPMVRLTGVDYIWPLVSRESQLLSMNVPKSSRVMFGENSLVIYTGVEHFKLKKKLLTAFTPVRLNDYLPCIQEHIRRHLLAWCCQGRMLAFPACEKLMADIMVEITLGCRKEHDPDGLVRESFRTVNKNLISLPLSVPGSGYYQAQKARKVLVEFILNRLSQRGDTDHISMLDVLLVNQSLDNTEADNGGLSREEIVDNALTTLIAGSGTTSGALSCLILMLGKYPDVLETLRAELNKKGLLHADKTVPLSYENILTLEYTQWIIKEVLRLLPPVGGAFRKAEKTLELGNYQVPKGWSVMYSIRDTHNTSDLFHDRNLFLPERWQDTTLQTTLRKPESCSYIPFGAGPRSCLGKSLAVLEMSVFLIELARLVDWELHNPAANMVYLPVTKCEDDLPVTFHLRQ